MRSGILNAFLPEFVYGVKDAHLVVTVNPSQTGNCSAKVNTVTCSTPV